MAKRTGLFFAVQGPQPDKSGGRLGPTLHMLKSSPGDILCVASELVTGKSLPVLMGIARLPIDRNLAWLVLSLGAVVGTLFSVYSSRAVVGMSRLGFTNRLLQLAFSLFLSLSFLLSVARGIHYERGLILSLAPSFCVVAQTLPQHQTTALVVFLLSCVVLSRCLTSSVAVPSSELLDGSSSFRVAVVPTVASGMGVEEEASTVWEVVLRALQLFVLAFYASVQHAPTQEYFHVNPGHHPHLLPPSRRAVYASSHHAMHVRYALLIGLIGALVRVTFWYIMCFYQDNTLHVMLENDHSQGPWDWSCCIVYMTALLYSGCWTFTQIREQVLPHLRLDLQATGRLKLLALLLALAALYRQRDDGGAIFMATNALTLVVLLNTALTLK